jgi:hypothetical protein
LKTAPNTYDFFAGFGFDRVSGNFATFDENSPVCGGFGFPRILITYLQSSLYALALGAMSRPLRICAPQSCAEEREPSVVQSLPLILAAAWRVSFRCLRKDIIRQYRHILLTCTPAGCAYAWAGVRHAYRPRRKLLYQRL